MKWVGQPSAPERLLIDLVEELGCTQSGIPLLDATERACLQVREEAERRRQLKEILRPIFDAEWPWSDTWNIGQGASWMRRLEEFVGQARRHERENGRRPSSGEGGQGRLSYGL